MRLFTCLLALVLLFLPMIISAADDGVSFLRDGDVWVFHGDSITHADTYRRACERVFRHYHPDAKVDFVQAGVWGSTSSDLAKRLKDEGRKPTIVSMMLGMNNAINGQWVKGEPREKPLMAYRQDITKFVQKYRADGAVVILMSPTLADETCRRTFFRIDGANDFLRDCQKIVKEIAATEGALYIPVQEEFEQFQETLDRQQKLRPDGVHPSSLGEYRIARSLWERMNFSGRLDGKERKLSEPVPRLSVNLHIDDMTITTEPAMPDIQINWSIGGKHGTAPQLKFPVDLKAGDATDAVVDVSAGGKSAMFIIDFCAVPVLHFTDNVINGTLPNAAKWKLRRNGSELLLDAEVPDSLIDSSSEWAFGRDGLNLFFDLRPANRFANINFDADVHQTMVNIYEKPFFAANLRPWMGDGMERAATCAGEKTANGYNVHMSINGRLNLHEPFALDKRDAIGISIAVNDVGGGKSNTYEMLPAQRPRDQYANSMTIIDLKDKIKADMVINTNVYPIIK
ncbi:MAG: GDSL-type esterase/lipase family protein [bacterium]